MKVYFITKSVAKNIYFESTPLHTCTLSMKNPTPCRISENAKRCGPRGFGGRGSRTLPVEEALEAGRESRETAPSPAAFRILANSTHTHTHTHTKTLPSMDKVDVWSGLESGKILLLARDLAI